MCGELSARRDGVADAVRHLSRQLVHRGHQVEVVCGGTNVDELPGATVRPVAGGWGPAGVLAAARSLRRGRFDAIHLHFAPSAYGYRGTVGLLPLLRPGRPLVVTLHEYGWWSWPPARVASVGALGALDAEAGLLPRAADQVVVTNRDHAELVTARHGRTPDLIPLAANLDVADAGDRATLRGGVRAAHGLGPDTPLLVFFGFVHATKGIRALLEAVRLVRRACPAAHLLLVGGFESLALRGDEARDYRTEVHQMVAAAGGPSAVTITDWQPERRVSELLQASDVVVLPFTGGASTKSGALLAAAAHGRPIVTTTPVDDELVDGLHARCVPVRDAGALADALVEVLTDPDLAARLRRGALQLAEGRDWETVTARHLAVYAEAVP